MIYSLKAIKKTPSLVSVLKRGNMEFARGANTFPGETTTFTHKGVVFETQGGLTATIGVYTCRI